jgi:hypothetical protein
LVDGAVEACGLSGVADREGSSFLIGVSVGHDARTVASMAPIYKGKLWDFRVTQTAGDFEGVVTKQQTDPAATDGSDGANMAGGASTETAESTDGSSTEITVVDSAATASDFVDDGTIATYETVTVTNADGTVTEETRVVGEEVEPTDEETAVEINLQIDDVEQMKETAGQATELEESLIKEEMDVEETKQDAEAEEVAAEEAHQ